MIPVASRAAAPRIAPVAEPTDEQRALLAKAVPVPGHAPPNVMATLVRHPTLMRRINALGGAFLAHGTLPVRERELVILRVAWRADSLYEYSQHVVLGRAAGLTEDEVRGVCSDTGQAGPGADADLIRFADAVLAREAIPDQLWSALRVRYTDEQLLELTALVGFYLMMAGIIDAARVDFDPGFETGWPSAEQQ